MDIHHLRRAPVWLPSASSAAGRLLPLLATGALEVLVKTENLGWQSLEGRGLGERLNPPKCFYL
jgi:hypothetical protein